MQNKIILQNSSHSVFSDIYKSSKTLKLKKLYVSSYEWKILENAYNKKKS